MVEVLPIKSLTDEDAPIFGNLGVILGKLTRAGSPVAAGFIVTSPQIKLKTLLEHYDFGKSEVFEQSLSLIKKDINAIEVPDDLKQITAKKHYFFNGEEIKTTKLLWQKLLSFWMEIIKQRLWNQGFNQGICQNLPPQVVSFVKKLSGFGTAFFDNWQDDVVINTKFGKLSPQGQLVIADLVRATNKKLLLPFEYEWIFDKGFKIAGIKPFSGSLETTQVPKVPVVKLDADKKILEKSAMKVILDLSFDTNVSENADGFYIAAEKIFDLNRPQQSFEDLVSCLVRASEAAVNRPVFFKLADISEGMGRVRGALRLLHQKSLFDPMVEVLDFARHKKGLTNINIVVPFIRSQREFLQIKRELATKKLMRKSSLQIWMEVAVLENIINLENYLETELDGIVLNLDELIGYLNGFDGSLGEMTFYKNETEGLLKFLEEGIRILHKAKIPVIAYGSLSLQPQVLEFLVDKGIWGVILDSFEFYGAHRILRDTEKRVVLRRS